MYFLISTTVLFSKLIRPSSTSYFPSLSDEMLYDLGWHTIEVAIFLLEGGQLLSCGMVHRVCVYVHMHTCQSL